MRIVSVARRSAVKARTQTINQLRGLLISAPDKIRTKLWRSKPVDCVEACAHLRTLGESNWMVTLATTLRLLAKRWLYLNNELKALDKTLEQLTFQAAKRMRKQYGVGPQTAAILLSVAGDNPERLRSEAALASLCGVNPLEASSGKTYVIVLIVGAIVRLIMPYGQSPWYACEVIHEHKFMLPVEPQKVSHQKKYTDV
jgi:transposase